MKPLDSDLSDNELNELEDFLGSPDIEDSSMDVSALEGFFAALALGPRTVMPSEWMPWVWDMHDREASPEFASQDDDSRILGLLMRRYNSVVSQILEDPSAFQPIYERGAQWGAAEWCEGFLLGIQLDQKSWTPLMVGEPTWFAPFMRLGTDEGMQLIRKEHDALRWVDEVVPSLLKIHSAWQGHPAQRHRTVTGSGFPVSSRNAPVVRATPKLGRNDPCHCDSGKKYKKCCGSGQSELH